MHLGPLPVPSPVSVASIAAHPAQGEASLVRSSPSGFLFFPERDVVLGTKDTACQNCTQCLPGFSSFSSRMFGISKCIIFFHLSGGLGNSGQQSRSSSPWRR